MTDRADLIARLLRSDALLGIGSGDRTKAATMLAADGKRIAELEAELDRLHAVIQSMRDAVAPYDPELAAAETLLIEADWPARRKP